MNIYAQQMCGGVFMVCVGATMGFLSFLVEVWFALEVRWKRLHALAIVFY